MVVTIHQPEHLPWLGFFHKMMGADVFVLLDNVQFRKNYFQNRNRIRTPNGSQWLTVPLQKAPLDTNICDTVIGHGDGKWCRKAVRSVEQCYSKAQYFKDYFDDFTQIYQDPGRHLSEFNTRLIRFLMSALGIKREILMASEMGVGGKRGDLLLAICQVLEADIYLSGISGREYLDLERFAKAGIAVSFQEFHHPIYPQLYAPFAPCMSSLDLLFNCGPASQDVIMGRCVEVMDKLFL